MPARGQRPDFSADDILYDWFSKNVWHHGPLPLDRNVLARLAGEASRARKEIDDRLSSVGSGKLDSILFWLGLAGGAIGTLALFVTPGTFPAAFILYGGGGSTLLGFGLSLAGGLRRKLLSEEIAQLRERARDLTVFQEEISAALLQVQLQRR
jgi:hypothetical protein